MKKSIILKILIIGMIFVLSGCSDQSKKNDSDNVTQKVKEQDKKDTEAAVQVNTEDGIEEKSVVTDKDSDKTTEKDTDPVTGNDPETDEDRGVDGTGEKNVTSGGNTDPFGVTIPENGGVNYEYEIVSAVYDNGDEAEWNHVTWFVCYQRGCSFVQAPIWIECEWEEAIGSMEQCLPANFTEGELELTTYRDMGEIGSNKTIRFNINKDSAILYNVEDGITYTCKLYTTFSWEE